MQRVLTTVTLLGLLVATAAAFAITQHLKSIKSPIAGASVSKVFSPTCHCATDQATVGIRLRKTDHVTVTILDSASHTVATLASNQLVQRAIGKDAQPTIFPWDGRTDAGMIAPDGAYYSRVALLHARHTFDLPNKILLDTQTPKVLSASRGKPVLLAGPGNSIAIHYSFDEPAHAVLFLGKQRLVVGRPTRSSGKVKWAGAVPEGTYVLSVAARDIAGNETPVAGRKHVSVVVRYIIGSPNRVTVRAGAVLAVHVQTASARYTWRLAGRHGAKRGRVLHVHAPTTPGTYRLTLAEHGHSTAVLVRVRA